MVASGIYFINTFEAININVNQVRVEVLGKTRLGDREGEQNGPEVEETHSRSGMTFLRNGNPGVRLCFPGSNLGRNKCLAPENKTTCDSVEGGSHTLFTQWHALSVPETLPRLVHRSHYSLYASLYCPSTQIPPLDLLTSNCWTNHPEA